MNDSCQIVKVKAGPVRRHDHRVQRLSRDYPLLVRLDSLAVDDASAIELIDEICWQAGVESPELRFHARRSPYTGATEPPRSHLVVSFDETRVQERERHTGRIVPQFGLVRLGRQSTLMTIAHELGHHFVFALDPHSTPGHGATWISRFDDAAAAIVSRLSL